jgi:hypothetical protein
MHDIDQSFKEQKVALHCSDARIDNNAVKRLPYCLSELLLDGIKG